MDEKELKRLLKRARDYRIKSEKAERELFGYIAAHTDNMDLSDIEFEAENSDNLEEAITCHIHYNESDSDSIIKKLMEFCF